MPGSWRSRRTSAIAVDNRVVASRLAIKTLFRFTFKYAFSIDL
jgi:hypothetical protein